MGPLVAIGGIEVPSQVLGPLEKETDQLCDEYGFPAGEEFKWSPGRELWMHSNLTGSRRKEFLTRVLTLSQKNGACVTIVIEDTRYDTATDTSSHEEDVTTLFLERAHQQCQRAEADGIVIVDRPSGSRADEDQFLTGCLETLQSGTRYVRPDRIALNVLSAPSKFVRLLQVADVVTGCTLALVAGESRFSAPVFSCIRPLLPDDGNRCGGVGLKIHPDYRYANLYYWLLGDQHFVKQGIVYRMPLGDHPYSSDANQP
jgi:hypothetical protein